MCAPAARRRSPARRLCRAPLWHLATDPRPLANCGGSCGDDRRRFCDKLPIKYGLESYFVPEGEGRKLEDARNQQKLRIVAAVLPSGRAAIKRLLLDGEKVYEEPLY